MSERPRTGGVGSAAMADPVFTLTRECSCGGALTIASTTSTECLQVGQAWDDWHTGTGHTRTGTMTPSAATVEEVAHADA